MISLAYPLHFDKATSVPKAKHLQKYVHAKPHNKLGRIIALAIY